MSVVDINVYCIASTKLEKDGLAAWLTDLEAERFLDQNIEMDFASDSVKLVGSAGKRCYNSFEPGHNPNVTKVREDWGKYLDHVLSVGHGSVLCHAQYSYAIEGLSRVCTAEMNRHSAGVAISEASMRFIRMKAGQGFPYWLPLSLRYTNEEYVRYLELGREGDRDLTREEEVFWHDIHRKVETQLRFKEVFEFSKEIYDDLQELWSPVFKNGTMQEKKKVTSTLRRIIPIGIATGGVWSFNLRALRHVLTMRCAEDAEEEICYVCTMILADILKREPLFFSDFYQDANGFWRPKYVKV